MIDKLNLSNTFFHIGILRGYLELKKDKAGLEKLANVERALTEVLDREYDGPSVMDEIRASEGL